MNELDAYLRDIAETNSVSVEEKASILEELSKYDASSAQLKFTILKIFIQFAVNEQHMKIASYHAFQLSKSKENDLKFLQEHFVEKIVEVAKSQSIPNSDMKRDIVLYCLAALKNLSSGNALLRKELIRIDTFQVIRILLSREAIKVPFAFFF